MKTLKKYFIIIFCSLAMLSASFVQAENISDAFNNNLEVVGDKTGYNTELRTVEPLIQNIINVALSFLGIIFLALMIYAGFQWMTAQGNEKKVSTSRQIMIAAVIGLIVVVAAYAITALVMSRFTTELAQ